MAATGAPLTTTLMPVPGRLTTATVLSVAALTPSSSARLAVKPSASKVWGVASSSKPSDTLPSPSAPPLGGGRGDTIGGGNGGGAGGGGFIGGGSGCGGGGRDTTTAASLLF